MPAYGLSSIAFVDKAQPEQGEVGPVVGDRLGLGNDGRGEPAGGDDRSDRATDLRDDAPDDPVDLTRESVEEPRLQGLDRRLADDGPRTCDLHLDQSRGSS